MPKQKDPVERGVKAALWLGWSAYCAFFLLTLAMDRLGMKPSVDGLTLGCVLACLTVFALTGLAIRRTFIKDE